MNLWIRSQQKEMLLKVNNNVMLKSAGYNDHYFIVVDEHKIGVYKSRERALEVLNEIQNKLKIICTDSSGGEYILAKNLVPIIYEIPKEW